MSKKLRLNSGQRSIIRFLKSLQTKIKTKTKKWKWRIKSFNRVAQRNKLRFLTSCLNYTLSNKMDRTPPLMNRLASTPFSFVCSTWRTNKIFNSIKWRRETSKSKLITRIDNIINYKLLYKFITKLKLL